MGDTSSASSGVSSFLTALTNISGSFPAIFNMVNVLIAFVGISLFIHAWWALNAHYAEPGRHSTNGMPPGKAIFRMTVGVVLSSAVYFIALTKNTLIGNSVSGDQMGYATSGLTAIQQSAVNALFGLFQILGLVAFAKGWLIIDAHVAGKQGLGWGAGITFIVAGVLSVFMQETLALIGLITGINLVNILLF